MSVGWRQGFADVIAAIKGTLADASNAGSMTAAAFTKLAGLPTSAVPTTRNLGTTAPLTGGGDLSADRTLAISPADAVNPGSLAAADFAKLASVPTGQLIVVHAVSVEVDFVGGAGNFYTVIPPTALKLVRLQNAALWLTLVGGTRSAVGQISLGTNSTADDLWVAQNAAGGLLTQPVNTISTANTTAVSPLPVLDLTTNGLRIKVISALTGAAPVCKGKITALVGLSP